MAAESRKRAWSELGTGARLFRLAHGVWGLLNLAGLGWVWLSALRRRRDRATAASMALLGAEGVALVSAAATARSGRFRRDWVIRSRCSSGCCRRVPPRPRSRC